MDKDRPSAQKDSPRAKEKEKEVPKEASKEKAPKEKGTKEFGKLTTPNEAGMKKDAEASDRKSAEPGTGTAAATKNMAVAGKKKVSDPPAKKRDLWKTGSSSASSDDGDRKSPSSGRRRASSSHVEEDSDDSQETMIHIPLAGEKPPTLAKGRAASKSSEKDSLPPPQVATPTGKKSSASILKKSGTDGPVSLSSSARKEVPKKSPRLDTSTPASRSALSGSQNARSSARAELPAKTASLSVLPTDSKKKSTAAAADVSASGTMRRKQRLHSFVVQDGDDGGDIEPEEYVVCVLGGGAAGKSSTIVRMLTGKFVDNVDPTLLDEYQGVIKFHGKKYHINFLDTAGQEQYREHRFESIERAHGYMLVYDVTQEISFDEIDVFINEVCRYKGRDSAFLPILVVGNKADLVQKRTVAVERASKFMAENDVRYVEVSAARNSNIGLALDMLMELMSFYRDETLAAMLTLVKEDLSGPRKRFVVLEKAKILVFKKQMRAPYDPAQAEAVYMLAETSEERRGKADAERFLLLLRFDEATPPLVILFLTSDERDLWSDRVGAHTNVAKLKSCTELN